ncbi:MAG TPA: ATP-binding protein [Candidatus Saccharimonadales bacterium]|nr:ATP-binding protein [Candidatus Saccharimonadales bacterium]
MTTPKTTTGVAAQPREKRTGSNFEGQETRGVVDGELLTARNYTQDVIELVAPLLVLDQDMRVQMANGSFCEHFKISREETVNRLVYELGNGQWDIPELRTLLEEVLPQKRIFQGFEVTHQFQSIGVRTMLLSGRQVDHVPRILLCIDDITEVRKANAGMRTSEVRYRRLFEAARDGILMLDPATRKITESNPFMTELLGYRREELVGKELWQIGLLKDEEANRSAFKELQEKHIIRYENLPLKNKELHKREVEFVSNLYDEGGREVIQCNIRDITERKEVERALVAATEEINRHAQELEGLVSERTNELQETVGELERFSYSVSHDMRAPLRAMQGYAKMLLEDYSGKLDAQGADYLQQILRSSLRLDRLIRDVLSYTRVLYSQLPMEAVDLDRLVREIITALPNGQPIPPEIQIEGKLPVVQANAALLSQCFSNLISNGVKFVSSGTTPRLEISSERASDGSVRVCIKDNGIGIAQENQNRVFGLFERLNAHQAYEGTGIGLTIVRKAAERMGARAGFESAPGEGSNFWIEFKKE